MPSQKDLKRVIRARMRKTGESYTSARARVLQKPAPSLATAPAPLEPPGPALPDYARLSGISNEAVIRQTGCSWEKWVYALDRHGAASLPHRDIARLVHEKYRIDGWWAQTVTVGYERIKGLRDKGQRRGGSYEGSRSRTFPVPIATLYGACATARARTRWLGKLPLTVRTATRNKSIRITWPDGTLVQLYFTAKGPGKSSVAVQHSGLPDREAVDRVRQAWAERLDALGQALSV